MADSSTCQIHWGPCASCGDLVYYGQRWASRMACEPCHTAALRANWAKRNRAKRKTFECAVCGDEFVSGQSPSKRRLTCEAHRPHVLAKNLRDYAKALATIGPTLHPFRQCEWCDHRFRGTTVTCSPDCNRAHTYFMQHRTKNRPWASLIHVADCDECGSRFVGRSSLSRFCGETCQAKAHRRARRPQRRADKHHRRLLRQAGDVFTNREIAERDGWRCHLCGRKIPDRPYSAKPDDLTIDHLVPVADGGAHTRANVAAAHNRCNYERQTGGTVQLLLVG